MPKEERACECAGQQGEGQQPVGTGPPKAVSSTGQDGAEGRVDNQGGEQGSEAGLGLPDAEPLVIVEQVGRLLNLLRLLGVQLGTQVLLPLQELVDLVEGPSELLSEHECEIPSVEL